MNELTHLLENITFDNVGIEQNDYLRDDTELLIGEQTYYIGLYKPFKSLYFEMTTFNLGDDLILEYWDGTAWVALPNLVDGTKNLSRNGFIKWNFQDDSKITESWLKTTIDSIEKHWIRITSAGKLFSTAISATTTANTETVWNISDGDITKYSVGQTIYEPQDGLYHLISNVDSTVGAANITVTPGTTLALADGVVLSSTVESRGVNTVYNDDNQLKAEVRLIDDYLAAGDSSFIAYHVSARDEIVQSLRNGGHIKNVTSTDDNSFFFNIGTTKQMNKWDLLDLGEVSQAAKYLCLAKIFLDVSENNEDKAYTRARDYYDKYGEAFRLYYMSLDLDDDGNTDDVESNRVQSITLSKV